LEAHQLRWSFLSWLAAAAALIKQAALRRAVAALAVFFTTALRLQKHLMVLP